MTSNCNDFTLQWLHIAMTSHCNDFKLQWLHIAMTSHCNDFTLQWLHTAMLNRPTDLHSRTSHCNDFTLQWLHIAMTSHCNDFTLQWLHTAMTSHCNDFTLQWLHTAMPNWLCPHVSHSGNREFIETDKRMVTTWPTSPAALSALCESTYLRTLLKRKPHSTSLHTVCRTPLGTPTFHTQLHRAYTMTATNHKGHKVYHDGHSNENAKKTNGILLRNCQIHSHTVFQETCLIVCGRHGHCLWLSLLNPITR